ncbi:tetratricopeptide repeat protein [Phenylobacterium montanum]|uniref:Tetratricopeptide repeat protein n=1 Tax=Phenylobacterium montanum TaxID=2823693 RepID=A0A975IV57_9CAUL|nr:tetratricopeptide repeat protein [Caulobacter sp. S6]QUD88440.1 tetratricopeptide repeat protein [Caulobacter sp. S6]
MSGIDQRLADALAQHRAGRIDEAAAAYAEILKLQSDHAEALHLLGVAEQQRGRLEASAELIRRALALRSDASYASNLANALLGLGRPLEAEQACRLALSIDAGLAMAYGNLGAALYAQDRRTEATEALQTAIRLDPARPEPQASLGVVLLELGRRDEAIAVLTALLAAHPNLAAAEYNLANALAADQTTPNMAAAVTHYDRAIALNPAYAEAHANRAALLRRLERYDDAEAGFALALRLAPQSALAHYNYGLLLGELDRTAEALAAHERAIALEPRLAQAHSHRGNMLSALQRPDEALAAHETAMRLAPGDALLHHNLGLSLAYDAHFPEAAIVQARAIALDPTYAPAHAALAAVLAELDRADEAEAAARQALTLEPDLAAGHSALGQALMAKGAFAEAEAALLIAAERRPLSAQSHVNLGVVRFRQGRFDEAEADYLKATTLRGDTWEAYYNLGVVRLQLGRYAEGWEGFEHRLRAPSRRRDEARYPMPLWRGEDLTGKTILLHGEQGLGDVLQCLRFVPQVAALGAEVVLEAHGATGRLVDRMGGVARYIEPTDPVPPADFHAPLFSLPHRLGVTLECLPGPTPYLEPDPVLTQAWRKRIDGAFPRPAPRVGVVWSGNVTAKVDRGRSIPLAAFAPLARAVGAPLISLQKQYGLEQLDALPAGMEVATLGAAYDAGDLADTAAVIQALDLVVACDTSVVHLAGAIGAPVWLAVNAVCDWRWLTKGEISPWYPSVRVWRQPSVGDWDGVFEAMADDWRSGQAKA